MDFEKNGFDLILIGTGNQDVATKWNTYVQCKCLFLDQSFRSYRVLGFKSQSKIDGIKQLFNVKEQKKVAQAGLPRWGTLSLSHRNILLMGGVLLTDGVDSFIYYNSEGSHDYPDIDWILQNYTSLFQKSE